MKKYKLIVAILLALSVGIGLGLLFEVDETVTEPQTRLVYEPGNLYKDKLTYERELWEISQIYKERTRDPNMCRIGAERVLNKQAFADTTPHLNVGGEVYEPLGSIGYKASGENLSFGYQLPAEAFQGWLDSAGHRKNLDNPNHTHSCISCHYFEDESSMYCVQLFAGH